MSVCVCVCVCVCWCVCVCVCARARGKSYRVVHLRRTHTIPLKFLSPSTCNANVTISLQSTRDCKCTCRLLIRQHIFQTYSLMRRSISPPGTGLETFFLQFWILTCFGGDYYISYCTFNGFCHQSSLMRPTFNLSVRFVLSIVSTR